MYSNVVTAIDKILRSYYVSTLDFFDCYGTEIGIQQAQTCAFCLSVRLDPFWFVLNGDLLPSNTV